VFFLPVCPAIAIFLPFGVFHWTKLLTLVLGFILVYLSLHLFQRRRAAWWSLFLPPGWRLLPYRPSEHLVHRITPAATFALLIVFRNRFSVRSESRKYQIGFRAAVRQPYCRSVIWYFRLLGFRPERLRPSHFFSGGLIRSLRQFSCWVIRTL